MSKIPKTILYLYSKFKGNDFQNIIIRPNVKYIKKNKMPIMRRNRSLGDFF